MQFATPDANQTWFDFSVSSENSEFDDLAVYSFLGTEQISLPYEFTIELVSRDSNLDMTEFLGEEALLTIADRSGKKRLVHGVIRQMEQLHTANAFTHYRCELVPRLWFLGQTQDHHIYQRQTVPQIIETILRKHRFLHKAYEFKLRETYPKREYCVQYGESDLHFLSRLCEEEGIYFQFEHSEDNHCLWFCDAEGGPAMPGESSLRFYPGSGHPADTAVVSRLNFKHRINSDSSTYREWNFTTPSVDLTGQQRETEWKKAPVPLAMELETYQFPHLYQERGEGERYTALQLKRQLTFRQWIECEADVSRFLPGFVFNLNSHPRDDTNRTWWIVSVTHKGEQPGVLEHEAPDGRGLEYKAVVTAIPDDVRYVPELRHKKVRIEGLQSAIVTGPSGEEVYCDKYGRVKVQFHWDRLGKHDETTTCWVRVADSWAGVNFGFIQAPRIGQEVMVEFMEGDPDRPVITGRVYNEALMPPWQLPEQKTLSGIQSREFKAARRNQLVLDDTQGQIQAQLSSDHDLSQLNLGYLTRVNHVEGRKDFRGEGFELRTDGWGVVRAAKGMYISTDSRSGAERHQKDMQEAATNLGRAARQHEDTAKLAEIHNAQDYGADVSGLAETLHTQVRQLRGNGEPHAELTHPHMVFSSPAGLALTTPNSAHIHTGKNAAVSAERHFSVSTGRSFLVSAMDKVSVFAHKLGMRFFAAKGKVEIQAQSDDLDVIADKVLQIISAKESVRILANKEVLLTAGGSYICINSSGIEEGTSGQWDVHAAQRSLSGSKSMSPTLPDLPKRGSAPLGGDGGETQGNAFAPAAGVQKSSTTPNWGMNMNDYVKLRKAMTPTCQSPRLQATLDEKLNPNSAEGKKMAEWQAEIDACKTTQKKAQKAEELVNKGINYTTDNKQYGTEDFWALPGDTLKSKHGDCEDYAILKYKLLAKSGVPLEDMEILIVTDPQKPQNPPHAILHVREDTGEKDGTGNSIYRHSMLDNTRFYGNETLIDQSQTRQYKVHSAVDNERCYGYARKLNVEK